MLEILNKQFNSKRVLTLNENFGPIKRENWPSFFWDMHPLVQEYYHELNPFFLFNLYTLDYFRYYKMFTVRDGMVTFANFLVNQVANLSKLGTKLYLIDPRLAPLVPSPLKHMFGTWSISRPNPLFPHEAKKIILFSFVSEQYLGNLDEIPTRLSALKNLREDVEIEIYFPMRKNVFEKQSKENVTPYELMHHVYKMFPNKKFKFLTSEHFMEKTSMRDTLVLDLGMDNFYVSDSYVHYFVHSRGGTIHGVNSTPPKDSVFDLALSFYHNLHVSPLPQVESVFTDLLLYKKQSPGADLIMDPAFQALVRSSLMS